MKIKIAILLICLLLIVSVVLGLFVVGYMYSPIVAIVVLIVTIAALVGLFGSMLVAPDYRYDDDERDDREDVEQKKQNKNHE